MRNKGERFEDIARKTIGSGGVSWASKGDIHTNDFVVECKMTDKKSFSITTKILGKLWNQALDSNKRPLLEIGIRDSEGVIWKLSCLVEKEKMR